MKSFSLLSLSLAVVDAVTLTGSIGGGAPASTPLAHPSRGLSITPAATSGMTGMRPLSSPFPISLAHLAFAEAGGAAGFDASSSKNGEFVTGGHETENDDQQFGFTCVCSSGATWQSAPHVGACYSWCSQHGGMRYYGGPH